MATLQQAIEILFQGKDAGFKPTASEAIAKLKEMQEAEKTAAAEADKLAKSLKDVGDKGKDVEVLSDALKKLATALVVKAFIDANVEVERFEKGMKAVLGSTADTSKELDYIRGVAEKFGVDLGTLTRGFMSLTAASIGTNLEGARTREIFEAVVKAMGAVGKSGAETEGALKAIEQMLSKGKVQLEEMRGQLGDRLPGAMQIAARAMGVTTVELEALVKKGLDVNDFLPAFAAELNRTFAGATFEGYTASMARLRNAIDLAFVDVGKAGAFDLLISGVNALTAILSGAVSTVKLFGETIGSFMLLLSQANTGNFGIFSADWAGFGDRAKESLDKAAGSTKGLIDALSGTKEAGAKAAEAITEVGVQARLRTFDIDMAAKSTAELDALLKRLGVDPKKFKSGLDEVASDLKALADNPNITGEVFLAAFEKSLKRIRTNDDINQIGVELTNAFAAGKISAETFNLGVNDLVKAQAALNKASGDTTKSVDQQAKALEKAGKEAKAAEEKASAFRLEMEKLASNERIKLIEAKVTLDVTNIQEQTKRVQAMLESIDNTVNSTGDLLKTLFGNISEFGQLDWGARRLVEQQIEMENKRRQDALNLQKGLTEAQIEYLRAQTKAIDRGDALIKVDGAGLQPHLEAFMWEILRTIQVRVNQDGLKMLLGV